MSEQIPNPFDPFFEKIREIVREEIKAAMGNGKSESPKKDWLKAEELAAETDYQRPGLKNGGGQGILPAPSPGVMCCSKDAT